MDSQCRFTRRFVAALLLVMALFTAEGHASETVQKRGDSWLERLAAKMIPQKTFNEAAGFFGPVTKKYLPVWDKFCDEYWAAGDKRAVVRKYIPQVDAALADAKAMKIPSKYEAKKAEYIKMFEALVLAGKLYVRKPGS